MNCAAPLSAGSPCNRLIYLHGFRSSPSSFKAQRLARAMRALGRQNDFICPQLPPSPKEAVALILGDFNPDGRDVLVGSSLGGFYARALAERCGARAVLINPATRPFEGLAAHTGIQTSFHGDGTFVFQPHYLDELQALYRPHITRPDRYLLIAATGDELLDWREMVSAWPGAQHHIVQGSDHGLSDFDLHLERVLAFAGLGTPSTHLSNPREPS